jgi:hypothetical protein
MKPGVRTSVVRKLEAGDIPQLVSLHRRVFRSDDESPADRYRRFFSEVFLNGAGSGSEAASLVYENAKGVIQGFLGVTARPMLAHGRRITAAISSNFMVEPGASGVVAIELLKVFLEGGQDLSIADEASDAARRLWEALGGTTSLGHSLHWILPLRPCSCLLGAAGIREGRRSMLSAALRPLASVADTVVTRLPRGPFQAGASGLQREELDGERLAAGLAHSGEGIRPDYDVPALEWLLRRAGEITSAGRIQRVAVVTPQGEAAGWYVYYLHTTRLSEVVAFHARPGFAENVLTDLRAHASQRGAVGLTGRLDPRYVQAFSRHYCFLHGSVRWMLVHSCDQELVDTFKAGDTLFSRLDGEWCCHLQ